MDDLRSVRTCLKCGKDFDSTDPGNRRCKNCRRVEETIIVPNIRIIKSQGYLGDSDIPIKE